MNDILDPVHWSGEIGSYRSKRFRMLGLLPKFLFIRFTDLVLDSVFTGSEGEG